MRLDELIRDWANWVRGRIGTGSEVEAQSLTSEVADERINQDKVNEATGNLG